VAASITYVHGSPIVLESGVIVTRLMRHGGVTHAVCRTSPLFMDVDRPVITTETLCGWETNLPWRNTSRFKPIKIDCMGCLVCLSRLCAG
jgi:hypothetical protein